MLRIVERIRRFAMGAIQSLGKLVLRDRIQMRPKTLNKSTLASRLVFLPHRSLPMTVFLGISCLQSS